MITENNLKEVLDNLQKEDIDRAMTSNKYYVAIEVNSYGSVFISVYKWSDVMSNAVHAAGNLFIAKDELLRLAKEVDTNNEHLKAYM